MEGDAGDTKRLDPRDGGGKLAATASDPGFTPPFSTCRMAPLTFSGPTFREAISGPNPSSRALDMSFLLSTAPLGPASENKAHCFGIADHRLGAAGAHFVQHC